MSQPIHSVVRGDTLWDISETYLGNPAQWPRLYNYNNKPAVIAKTGRGIIDPDLIYPGQKILIPAPPRPPKPTNVPRPTPQSVTEKKPSPQPPRPNPPTGRTQESLKDQLPTVRMPLAFKYKLNDIKLPPILIPAGIIEIKMEGSIVLKTKDALPIVVNNRRQIELSYSASAEGEFNKLIGDNKFIFEPESNKLTLRSMLVSKSNTPGIPAYAVGTQISSDSPIPKLRFEFILPNLQGNQGDFQYITANVKMIVEFTPAPPLAAPSPQPVRIPQPSTAWDKVLGTGLIVVGGVIIVATLVEDVLTLGAGIADDPPTLAIGSGLVTAGMATFVVAPAILEPPAPTTTTLQFKADFQ